MPRPKQVFIIAAHIKEHPCNLMLKNHSVAAAAASSQAPRHKAFLLRVKNITFGRAPSRRAAPPTAWPATWLKRCASHWAPPSWWTTQRAQAARLAPPCVARATPDGYTLLLNHIGMSTMPTLYRKLSFNVANDFEYLGIINDVPMTLIGARTCPPTTTRSCWPGWDKTRARSIWATPGWDRPRTCAA